MALNLINFQPYRAPSLVDVVRSATTDGFNHARQIQSANLAAQEMSLSQQRHFADMRREVTEGFAMVSAAKRQEANDQRQRAMDSIALRQQEIANERADRAFEYGINRDQVQDSRADRAFEYGVNRDEISDEQWKSDNDWRKQREEGKDFSGGYNNILSAMGMDGTSQSISEDRAMNGIAGRMASRLRAGETFEALLMEGEKVDPEYQGVFFDMLNHADEQVSLRNSRNGTARRSSSRQAEPVSADIANRFISPNSEKEVNSSAAALREVVDLLSQAAGGKDVRWRPGENEKNGTMYISDGATATSLDARGSERRAAIDYDMRLPENRVRFGTPAVGQALLALRRTLDPIAIRAFAEQNEVSYELAERMVIEQIIGKHHSEKLGALEIPGTPFSDRSHSSGDGTNLGLPNLGFMPSRNPYAGQSASAPSDEDILSGRGPRVGGSDSQVGPGITPGANMLLDIEE